MQAALEFARNNIKLDKPIKFWYCNFYEDYITFAYSYDDHTPENPGSFTLLDIELKASNKEQSRFADLLLKEFVDQDQCRL